MSIQWQKPGINHVGEYQSSGHVFVVPTGGGPFNVTLVNVSSAITVYNDNADAQVTFFSKGDVPKTINLESVGQHRFNVKCIKFQLTSSAGNVGAVAELTNIPSGSFVYVSHSSLGTIT